MIGRFYVVGILVGLTAGFVATFIGGAFAGLFLGLAGVDLGHNAFENPLFIVLLLIAASVGFITSGFATARCSPGDWIFDVAATSVVILFLNAVAVLDAEIEVFPFWFNLSLLCLSAPLVLAGGRLHSRRLRVD